MCMMCGFFLLLSASSSHFRVCVCAVFSVVKKQRDCILFILEENELSKEMNK